MQNFFNPCNERPEAHLHPNMQYKFLKFLKQNQENQVRQIFITSHSLT